MPLMKYAIRQLVKSRGFAVVAIATLALGIAVNTTSFSVLNRLLFQTLPFRDPGRLVQVWAYSPQLGTRPQAPGDFIIEKEHNSVFSGMAVYVVHGDESVVDPGQLPTQMVGMACSANFFPLMGIQPALGRGFSDDDQAHQAPVTLISNSYWKTHFGGDARVLGHILRVHGVDQTVIGVLPEKYDDPVLFGWRIDIWTLDPTEINRDKHDHGWYWVAARLKPGVSFQNAQTEMDLIAATMAHDFPKTNALRGLRVMRFPTNSAGDFGEMVTWLVMNLSLAVLLIACVNLANLQLVRVTARTREFSVRMALGSPRSAIMQMLLLESLLLSFAGGVVGLTLTVCINQYLSRFLGVDLPINFRIVIFAFVVSTLTGIIFGIAPAFFALRSNSLSALKQEGRGYSVDRSRHRFRSTLIVVEVALALVLLSCAAFFVRGLQRISHRDLGWNPDGLLIGHLSLTHEKYGELHDDRSSIFAKKFQAELENLPGVDGVAMSRTTPALGLYDALFEVEGRPPPPAGQEPEANIDSVTPGFLRLYRMRLLQGRDFTADDRRDTQPVAIINKSMAERFWPGQNPIGKRIHEFPQGGADLGWTQIVGVTNDVSMDGDLEANFSHFTYYRPFAQLSNRFLVFTLHTNGDPRTLKDSVRRLFAQFDPDTAISVLSTPQELIDEALSTYAFTRRMLVAIAFFGLLLSALGIYGVIANLASERTREVGIRIALGAQAADIRSLFMGNGIRIALLGTAVGVLGSFVVVRILSTRLAEVPGDDPIAIALVALVPMGVALVASWLPARRATRVDPLISLRGE
jgi:putative ABC transport system permease protein